MKPGPLLALGALGALAFVATRRRSSAAASIPAPVPLVPTPEAPSVPAAPAPHAPSPKPKPPASSTPAPAVPAGYHLLGPLEMSPAVKDAAQQMATTITMPGVYPFQVDGQDYVGLVAVAPDGTTDVRIAWKWDGGTIPAQRTTL